MALFALGVVLTQLVNDPPAVAGADGPDRDIGIWLAVAGALLMAIGAFLATASISLAIEPRRPPAARLPAERGGRSRRRDREGAARPGSLLRDDPPSKP